jgi:predicted nucleic acid-binding protein
MLKIYLDTSVYNRPFDDQNQSRIRLETTAFRSILSLIDLGALDLVGSTILDYEINRNPFPTRHQWIRQQLNKAKYYQNLTQSVIIRASILEQQGLKKIDALHVASAEISNSRYFLACDDRLIRRYQGNMNVMNPVNFILSLTGE